MDARERWAVAVDLMRRNGRVTVAELSDATGVSAMTARRDFEALERQGALRRFHGGAAPVASRGYEPPFALRAGEQAEAKERLAARAAQLVAPGEVVMIDSGTTALAVARAVARVDQVTIVTPNVRAAEIAQGAPGVRVILTGGTVRPGELSLVGDLAVRTFEVMHCDAAFLGVAGIDAEAGATEYSLEDTSVKRAAIRTARRTVIVADASKLGVIAVAQVCPIAEVDVLVTEASGAGPALDAIRATGTEVLLA
jgi:DeoR/GlpR family transcriptional regulator of sugar metabolism